MKSDQDVDLSPCASEREALAAAEAKGIVPAFAAYFKLSGPGWLQSALTLGGGSLGSSLYLGALAGTTLLWLQPLAMLLGVIMLSAISYVALSTDVRPFVLVRDRISPLLAWSWLLASLMANIVWSMPQYALSFAVLDQNLLPLFQSSGGASSGLNAWLVSGGILFICTAVTWSYGAGHWGVKVYEAVLKIIVAIVVASFLGVVLRMSSGVGGADWGAILSGFVPDLSSIWRPADALAELLKPISDPAAQTYWRDLIVSQQRDVMLSAGAAAVGINMTFLMPYSLLARGWTREFRGLARFDLLTGTLIPYVLATSAIVIVAAACFHGTTPCGFEVIDGQTTPPERFEQRFTDMLNARVKALPDAEIGEAERRLASTLVKRDTFDLAKSLERLFVGTGNSGSYFAQLVFGVGVLGMTLSSISLMMVISGFVVCELFGRDPTGWTFRLGSLASATGVLWPVFWSGDAMAWLTVVAGVVGSMLLPIAYVTFFLLMNHRDALGDARPTGRARIMWNTLMLIAAVAATAAGVSAIAKKAGWIGLSLAVVFAVVAFVSAKRQGNPASPS